MSRKVVDVRGADAESGAPEQVVDVRVELRHVADQSAIVTTPSVKVVVYRRSDARGRAGQSPDRCGCSATRGTDTRRSSPSTPVMVHPSCVQTASIAENVLALVRASRNTPAVDSTSAAPPTSASADPATVTCTVGAA